MGVQDVMEQAPSEPSINFDALIQPALDALDSSIAPLQQGYETTVSGLDQQAATRRSETQQNIGQQEQVLERGRTSQQQSAESAANEARRQFSEIGQGIQARYGGTTGTGAFATELAGRQSMKNIGNIRTALSGAMREIDDKLGQVKEVGRIALADIEDRLTQEKAQAKSELDNQLADIRRQKGELQSRKAELAMQAMQIYQQTVSQVNARNAAFKQQLYVQQQQAENQLKLALQRAGQVAQSYTVQDFTTMAQQLSPLVAQGLDPRISGKLKGGGQISIGAFKPEEEELSEEEQIARDMGLR